MPNVNLSRMTVEALMDLRKRVDEMLHKRRAELQQQLESIAVIGGGRGVVRGGGSALKGREEKSRRNIGAVRVRLGQVVAQDLVGLLLRSKVERSSMIS